MKLIKIIIETLSNNEPAYNNEEVRIVRNFSFDITILDTFNPVTLLSKIILEECIDPDTITSITYKEV